MWRSLCLTLAVALYCSPVWAGDCGKNFSVNDWGMLYHQSPRPDQAGCAFNEYVHAFLTDEKALKNRYFSGTWLMATVLRQSPERMEDIYAEATAHPNPLARQFATDIFDIADTAKSLGLLARASKEWPEQRVKKYIAARLQSPNEDLYRDEAPHPAYLDALWSEFFVTGAEKPVKRIYEAAGYLRQANLEYEDIENYLRAAKAQNRSKKELQRVLVGGAATWSLRLNIQRRRRVREIMRRIAPNDPRFFSN